MRVAACKTTRPCRRSPATYFRRFSFTRSPPQQFAPLSFMGFAVAALHNVK
jgi:hypothetical protein